MLTEAEFALVAREVRARSGAVFSPEVAGPAEIRLTPRFIELHDRIWHAMKAEVLKGYAQTRNRTTS